MVISSIDDDLEADPSCPEAATDKITADTGQSEQAEALAAVGISEWEADLVSGEVRFSPWLTRLFGLDPDRWPTIEEIRARYHPEDRQRIAAATDGALADPARGFFRDSFRVLGEDGNVAAWLEARASIFRDAGGRARRTVGVILDVTDHKEREAALEASRASLEAALANMAIVLFQQDRALRYTWVHNPKLGHAAASVLGKTDLELLPPAFAEPLQALKRRVIETGNQERREVETVGPEGVGRYDLHVEPLRDGDGEIIGVTCAAIELLAEASAWQSSGHRRAFKERDLLLDSVRLHRPTSPPGDGAGWTASSALHRKLGALVALTREASYRLRTIERKMRLVPAKHALRSVQADGSGAAAVIINGWAFSYELLADGARQIIGFHLPGDLIGFNSRVYPGSQRSYLAVNDCVVCDVDEAALTEIIQSKCILSDALLLSSARDEALIEQHLVNIGRRRALARVARLLLELGERLKVVHLGDDFGYRCPLTQELIGDALGLTGVHVNRMLRQLRDRGCLTFRNGYVAFRDRAQLRALAEYEPGRLEGPDEAPAAQERSAN